MSQKSEDEVVVPGALQGARNDGPGKVAAFGSDAEDGVVGKERWEEIHRLRAVGASLALTDNKEPEISTVERY